MNSRLLFEHIERIAPLQGAAAWDKSGIQIAASATDITTLAVALDPLPATVEKALAQGAQCLLTHHPLHLTPRFLDRIDDYHRVVSLLLRRDAWLYAAHTSLDANRDGPAAWLAEELGLRDRAVLEPSPASAPEGFGFGLVGALPAPLSWPDFTRILAERVPADFWIVKGPVPDQVTRLAYCPGSGGSMAGKAFAAGADVYITGDMKYHQLLEEPGCIIDVGHFALEEEMTRRLALALQADPALAQVDIRFIPGQDPRQAVIIREAAPKAAP